MSSLTIQRMRLVPALLPLIALTVLIGCAASDDASVRNPLAPRVLFGITGDSGRQCTVAITGPVKVCLDCEKEKQPSTKLTAVGSPAGGTFAWDTPSGGSKVSLKSSNEKAFVTGVEASTATGDVKVHVRYAVGGMTCENTHAMTVLKPTSLRVLDNWQFVVTNGQVTSITKNGVPQAQPIPVKVANDANAALKKVQAGQSGALLVRYYEVLDQFGKRWECDADLKETIAPKGLEFTGGSRVKQGIPENPDRIFLFQKPPFVEQTIVQTITVGGCIVRRNKITLKADAVVVEEVK